MVKHPLSSNCLMGFTWCSTTHVSFSIGGSSFFLCSIPMYFSNLDIFSLSPCLWILSLLKSKNGGLSDECIPWIEGFFCAFISASIMVLSFTFSPFLPPMSHSMVEIIALQWPFGFSLVVVKKPIEEVCNCLANCFIWVYMLLIATSVFLWLVMTTSMSLVKASSNFAVW